MLTLKQRVNFNINSMCRNTKIPEHFFQSHRSEMALFQVDFDSKAMGEFQHQLDISL